MEPLEAARLAAAFVLFVAAAAWDWKKREVPDGLWVLGGVLGLLLWAVDLSSRQATWAETLLISSAGLLIADIFWDRPPLREQGKTYWPGVWLYIGAAGLFVVGAPEAIGTEAGRWALLTPILVALFELFYFLDLLRGGADAKAFIILALLLPAYPDLDGGTLTALPSVSAQQLFPFSLVVLFNTAVLLLVLPPLYLVRNLLRGDRKLPQALVGYRMDLAEIPKRRVWLLEYYEGGAYRLRTQPRRSDDLEADLAELRARGVERPWVTPKLPFLVVAAAGLPLSAWVGNALLFLLFGLGGV